MTEIKWKEIGSQLVDHIYLSFSAILLAIIIGVLLAIIIFKFKKASIIMINIAGVMQTIPSLAMFGLLIPFIYSIDWIVILTLTIYAIFPITSNTIIGLQSVDKNTIDVGASLGLSPLQSLIKIRLRLGLTMIIGGIRIASILVIGTATIAVFIGAGGLGEIIMTGINRREISLVLQGTIPVALVAITTSLILHGIEKIFVVKGA